MPDSLCLLFFTTLDLIWPKLCPLDQALHFASFFFADFQLNILGDSIIALGHGY